MPLTLHAGEHVGKATVARRDTPQVVCTCTCMPRLEAHLGVVLLLVTASLLAMHNVSTPVICNTGASRASGFNSAPPLIVKISSELTSASDVLLIRGTPGEARRSNGGNR